MKNNNRKANMTTKPNADKLIMDLAYFTEVNPSADPKVNKFYKMIRQSYQEKGYILKFGKCAICGEEGVLCEIGLSWACNWNDKCKKDMEEWERNNIKEWQKNNKV